MPVTPVGIQEINNKTITSPFSYSRNMTGGEHTVRATKWVMVNKLMDNSNFCGTNNDRSGCPRGGAPVAGLNDDAQWIILMGFLVSFSFFFLALVINQSTVVGQTTAESVIEFSKNDIRDVRDLIIRNTTVSNSDGN